MKIRDKLLRDALDSVVTKMSWREGRGIIHDPEAWRTLVGCIVMATNGDNDGQVPMGVAEPDPNECEVAHHYGPITCEVCGVRGQVSVSIVPARRVA